MTEELIQRLSCEAAALRDVKGGSAAWHFAALVANLCAEVVEDPAYEDRPEAAARAIRTKFKEPT